MKYLSLLAILVVFSVATLWYLITSTSFMPLDSDNNYIWVNILVFLSLFALGSISLLTLLLFLFQRYILKKDNIKVIRSNSFKLGFFITIGIIGVVILNFFHILNIFWGLGLLTLLIIIFIII